MAFFAPASISAGSTLVSFSGFSDPKNESVVVEDFVEFTVKTKTIYDDLMIEQTGDGDDRVSAPAMGAFQFVPLVASNAGHLIVDTSQNAMSSRRRKMKWRCQFQAQLLMSIMQAGLLEVSSAVLAAGT